MRLEVSLVLIATLGSAGCTAGIATARLVAADRALQQATEAGAEFGAPYEYRLANRYYEKALETTSWNDYRVAMTLADEAARLANASVVVTQGGERGDDVNRAGEDLTDERSAKPDKAAPTPDPFGDIFEDEVDRGATEKTRKKSRDQEVEEDEDDLDFIDEDDELDLESP